MPLILISPAKTMTFTLEHAVPAGVRATRPVHQRTAAAIAARLAQVLESTATHSVYMMPLDALSEVSIVC